MEKVEWVTTLIDMHVYCGGGQHEREVVERWNSPHSCEREVMVAEQAGSMGRRRRPSQH